MATASLDLDFGNAQDTVIVLSSVRGKDADRAQFLELEGRHQFRGKGQLGSARVYNRVAGDFLPALLGRKELVLPVPDFDWHREHAHAPRPAGFVGLPISPLMEL